MAELNGMPPEKIQSRLGPDPQEMLAKKENDVLLI